MNFRVAFEMCRKPFALLSACGVLFLLLSYAIEIAFYLDLHLIKRQGYGPDEIIKEPSKFMGAGQNGDAFAHFAYYGFCAASALAIATFLWERRPPRSRIYFLWWPFLVLAMALSYCNYWQADAYVERSTQALLDIAVVVLSLLCLFPLAYLTVSDLPGRIMKSMAVMLITLYGVAVPGAFAALWTLDQLHISFAPTGGIDSWVSALGAAVSGWVGCATYMQNIPPKHQNRSPIVDQNGNSFS